jgi:hypothetical protein
MTNSAAAIRSIGHDFPVTDLENVAWNLADAITISTYWNGSNAPRGRSFEARLLWSRAFMYVRFDCEQEGPLIVSDQPDATKKTVELWERDVCEIFVAPDTTDLNRYFEFEVAPTGEWLDLGIVAGPDGRETDWDYSSGMRSAARIDHDLVLLALQVPWKAFGRVPESGDIWAGNLFRCVGTGPDRGYLAWHPTMTDQPNFHVPRRFGSLRFVN